MLCMPITHSPLTIFAIRLGNELVSRGNPANDKNKTYKMKLRMTTTV